MAVRTFCSGSSRAACALVLYHRRGDGHRRYDSQLEQGLAALVLVIVAPHLAGELLDWLAAWRTPGGFSTRLSCRGFRSLDLVVDVFHYSLHRSGEWFTRDLLAFELLHAIA